MASSFYFSLKLGVATVVGGSSLWQESPSKTARALALDDDLAVQRARPGLSRDMAGNNRPEEAVQRPVSQLVLSAFD